MCLQGIYTTRNHLYSLFHHQDQDSQKAQGGQCDPAEINKKWNGGTDKSKTDGKVKIVGHRYTWRVRRVDGQLLGSTLTHFFKTLLAVRL